MEIKEPSIRYSPHGRGYILLWKKALSSAVFQDADIWKVFCWCLLRANWQPTPLYWNGEETKLERGQFITGRFSARDELRMAESKVYRALQKLQKMEIISLKSNNKFTIITICNYESYQNPSYELEQPLNNQRTTTEQPLNTDKEYKNTKKDKNIYGAIPNSLEESVEYFLELGATKEMAEDFFDHFQSNGWKVGGKSPMKDWRAAARRWKRQSINFKGHNGTAKPSNISSATARATFRHTEKDEQRFRDIAETIAERDRARGQQS